MMWRKSTLRLTDSLPPLTCTVLPVHPWTPGVGRKAATGSYLSPQNAAHWLAQKLSGTGRNLRVMVVMLLRHLTAGIYVPARRLLSGVTPASAGASLAHGANSGHAGHHPYAASA